MTPVEYAIELGDGSLVTAYTEHIGTHVAVFTSRADVEQRCGQIQSLGIDVVDGRVVRDSKYSGAHLVEREVPAWRRAGGSS